MKISNLSLNTPPSGIRAVFNSIAEATDVISFALGEPDFTTPQPIIDEACRYFQDGATHYTPNAGLFALRRAIAEKYPERDCKPEQVVVTAGATEALLLTLLTLLNPGDGVLVSEPYWPTYIGQLNACGAVTQFVRTYEEDGFSLKPENVERCITDKTKMLIINSPANPTGAVISPEDMRALADLAIKYDLTVLSDEVYRHIMYEGEFHSIAELPGMRERCIVIDSFSKTYSMTGWRIGYAIAPEDVAFAMTNMHEYSVSCISEPIQMAAVKALVEGDVWIGEMVEEFRCRRDLIVEGIRGLDGLSCICPKATFYLYFNIAGTGLTAHDFVYSLLESKRVALSPGNAFGEGQEKYVRLSYANSQENLREGLCRIAEFVSEL